MSKRFIIALDEGTTSARALVYDKVLGKIISVLNETFNQIYPFSGWVEHNAKEIWEAQLSCLKQVCTNCKITPEEIYAIGITNQRETVVMWDKLTGEPIHNAIVWQCRRTADFCEKLKTDGLQDEIKERTGLLIDAYFSASKIRWLLDNEPKAKQLLASNRLCAGTIDSYLIFKLTEGRVFVTDPSNASRTQLFNINTMEWDERLLEIYGVPIEILPKVVDNSEIVGYTNILGKEVAIAGIAGDQQAALFGQACFKAGQAKNTYGTGCFMLMNTGGSIVKSKKLLTTVAWRINDKTTYALEGSIFNAGSSVQWLRDEVGIIEKASDTEAMSFSVTDTKGVYFVPAFTGLGAPYWNMDARGAIVGITRDANKCHIVRAALESIAYNTKAIFDEMTSESKIKLFCLRCDGGVSKDNFLMQFQADILQCRTEKQQNVESTAMGVVFLAGLATGAFKSIDEISESVKMVKAFCPNMNKEKIEELYEGWKNAVKLVCGEAIRKVR